MSRATEIAEAEAQQAENDDLDDAQAEEEEITLEDTPEEPEPSEAVTEAPSEKEIEQQFDKMERENVRHAKRLAEIMGDAFADLTPCPCCQIPGFVFPFQEFSPGDQDRRSAVLAYMGEDPNELVQDPETERCGHCKGRGYLHTGSLNGDNVRRLCNVCSGSGYVMRQVPVSNPQPTYAQLGGVYSAPTYANGNPSPSPIIAEQAPPQGWTPEPGRNGNDNWGRWPGHARYGIDPTAPGGQW